jgi:lysophospholipase L1-like esterase
MKLIGVLIFTIFFFGSVKDDTVHLEVKETEAPDPPKSILIIGDSQSATVTKSGQSITWTWPNHLKKILSPYGVTVDVEAIGGKTSSWMLSALKKRFQSGGVWDRVILYGGGNDASNMSIPLDTTISNFQKMIDIANSKGCDVWVNLGWKIEGRFMDINILPVGRPANLLKKKSDWIPYIEKRKTLQSRLKSDLTGCQFIEPYDLQSKTSDGIHPTPEGHKLVCDFILKTIDTASYK